MVESVIAFRAGMGRKKTATKITKATADPNRRPIDLSKFISLGPILGAFQISRLLMLNVQQ